MISFIVPVYNCEKYLATCVDSLLKTGKDNEIILVDDGSSDSSPMICDNYASNNEKIKVFHIPNGGPSGARNVGIRNANEEYISFVDSDDYIDDKVYRDIMNIIENERVDMVFTQMSLFDETSQVFVGKTDPRMDSLKSARYNQEKLLKILINCKITPSPCRYVIKSSIIKGNNIYFKEHIQHEDTLWYPQLIVNCENGYYYDKPFYNIRMRLGSRGKLNHELRRKSILLINDELIAISKDKNGLQKDFIFQNVNININFLMREYASMDKGEKEVIKNWLIANKDILPCLVKYDGFKRKVAKVIGYYNAYVVYAKVLNLKVKVVDSVGLIKGKMGK